MNLILDSNVILAAFAARGLCEAVFEACILHHHVYTCEHILKEVEKNLEKKIKLPAKNVRQITKYLEEVLDVRIPAGIDPDDSPDPKDVEVLGLVRSTECDYLVTGDRKLLDLRTYATSKIVSPRSFWEVLQGRP